MASSKTVGEYLIDRLYDLGVRHVFGVPGDFALGFFDLLAHSKLQVVNTCDEQGAGFAADAYSRLKGIGVLCVTYCVGGLKVMNPVAQAYAEKSPVIVISGAPGIKERVKHPVLHHKIKDFDTQFRMFEQITVASTVLRDGESACREIDRVLESVLRFKLPVYIEFPRDVVGLPIKLEDHRKTLPEEADQETFQEAISEAVKMINAAQKLVIIAGIELHRFGLQDSLLRFVEKTGIPAATTIDGKSVISDRNPLSIGVYEGAMGFENVRLYVESSDCVILLGAILSDVNLGGFTAHLDQRKIINATNEKVSIRHHGYDNVTLRQFLEGLIGGDIKKRELTSIIPRRTPPTAFVPVQGRQLTTHRLFHRINSGLEDNTVVIAEPGDALFGGADLYIHGATEFISPAYYLSLGFAVPAVLGVQLARPDLRPLVLVGDGAFQMTGVELSTIARFGLNPIIIVLNNGGYSTERPMMDGSFNDVLNWNYGKITEVLQTGKSFDVETEDQLDQALLAARDYKSGFSILNVHINPHDSSPALHRLTESLGKRVK